MSLFKVIVSLIVNPTRDAHLRKPETQDRHYLVEAGNIRTAKKIADDGASHFMSTWSIDAWMVTDEHPLEASDLQDIADTQRLYHQNSDSSRGL